MSIKREDMKPIENGTQNSSSLLGRPNTVSPKRLPSFKAPRDLTLGLPKASLAMTAKSRKKFTPNIPTRRDKSGDASDGKPDDSSRQGNRGRRGKWEGRGRGGGPSRRNKPVFIQTAGSVFGEGIAEAPKRFHQNSEYSNSREDTSSSLVKTKLNLERQDKVDKKEEELKLQALLKCDFVDDPSSAPDESFRPISIPLLQELKTEPGWEESAGLSTDNCINSKVVVKEEPDSGDEEVLVHKQKQVVTQPAMKRGLNEYSIMELLECSKKGYVMLQLPTCLPGPKPDIEMPAKPGKSSGPPIDASKVEGSLDEVSEQLEECTLNTLPEGHLGMLRVRASGKAEIILNGGYPLVVNPATQVGFLQGKRNHEEDGEVNDDGELDEPQRKIVKSPKKNSKRRSAYVNAPVVNEAVDLIRSINARRVEKDEYSLFGEQVAVKLRKITSPYAKYTVQNIINKVLFEAEMGKFDHPSAIYPYFPAPVPTFSVTQPSFTSGSPITSSGFTTSPSISAHNESPDVSLDCNNSVQLDESEEYMHNVLCSL